MRKNEVITVATLVARNENDSRVAPMVGLGESAFDGSLES
jgi:hypothetical protein